MKSKLCQEDRKLPPYELVLDMPILPCHVHAGILPHP